MRFSDSFWNYRTTEPIWFRYFREASTIIKFDNFDNSTLNIRIFYLLFGMQKHEPWGLVQKYFLSCMPCKSFERHFAKKFAKRYVSSAGIPLVEKVNKRPEGSSLETRVQILETLLRDYYLDDFYLEKVKNIIINHNKFLARYNEMNGQNNDNPELNTSSV
ncbi:hypothetical protein C1645_744872 [Glomus cerebriforme]|uniref:Uncharacterized protein n=1 Tax=Glomus cerebriforme TaxID=658196 RepID=A0A397S4M1_9GLOM|nr:hypothetical protein C1645_744872 [Glomus cerebriforme]